MATTTDNDQQHCPSCQVGLVPLLIGFPSPEGMEQARRGEVVLGGCLVRLDGPQPMIACRSCGRQFTEDGVEVPLVADPSDASS